MSEDSGVVIDAGVVDAGVVDAGVVDAGVVDAGAVDAGVVDAGVVDASVVDAGVVDAGVVDASVADAGAVDAGAVDAGVIDAGVVDAGAVDAGPIVTCATVRCAPWAVCVEDAGASCIPTVSALRFVVPSFDASIPIDTIRLSIAVEVTGTADSIPVSGGLSSTTAMRTDAGLAVGALSFVQLDAGLLFLTAGWSGGPQTTTVVNVLPVRAIEVVGPNPPSHGVNTAEFEPNDPEGNAWRLDDVVPIRNWPDTVVAARHDSPDASTALLREGAPCDGGCSGFYLQDLEFNAFRDNVELRAISDAGWEARPQRIIVTRWRWRRVVAGVPNPIKVQTPVVAYTFSASRAITIGTNDTGTTGRLVFVDAEGNLEPGWAPQWTAAVTAPIAGCLPTVAGFDGDAGFLSNPNWEGFRRPGERYSLLGAADNVSIAVTEQGDVISVEHQTGVFPPNFDFGRCGFDGGRPTSLAAGAYAGLVSSSGGEICEFLYTPGGAGSLAVLPVSAYPRAISGQPPAYVTRAGVLIENSLFGRKETDAGAADTLVSNFVTYYITTPTPQFVEVRTASLGAGIIERIPLFSRITEPPVMRSLSSGEQRFFAVDDNGRLIALASSPLRTLWSWAPDGGLPLSSAIGFAPSATRLGSLLIPTRASVLSVVASKGTNVGNWSQSGGDPANCGGDGVSPYFDLP
ncbi:MAG: hypothetical protein GQE15_35555 [Archangiaceae bacterium]|nr:hypothetical protein [Archangiaceae bacterium]